MLSQATRMPNKDIVAGMSTLKIVIYERNVMLPLALYISIKDIADDMSTR